jgi:SAM-dependent methyltransferase
MDDYLATNRKLWNAWTPFHVDSQFYDVAGFKAGREALDRLELGVVGPVEGKSLLHLQCHFGMSTLAWARHGATVTGIDFSDEAIRAARSLAVEMGIEATFVLSDLSELPQNLTGPFDVVFTSYGALPWLPDLRVWGQVVAHFLKPGGIIGLVEAHPLLMTLDDTRADRDLRVTYPYFVQPEPLRFEQQGSYAAPEAPVRSISFEWMHSFSEIIGSLLEAGLSLESLAEHRLLAWPFFAWMERGEDGFWRLPEGNPDIPLSYSLRARRKA